MLKNKKGLIIIGIMVFVMFSLVACKTNKKEDEKSKNNQKEQVESEDNKKDEDNNGLVVKDEADSDASVDFGELTGDTNGTTDNGT